MKRLMIVLLVFTALVFSLDQVWADTDVDVDSNVAMDLEFGGTNATSAAGARTNLGLAIGTDVQAYDAQLADVADGKTTTLADNDGATLTTANFGVTYICDSGSDRNFTLPSVAAGDVGGLFRFIKLGAGKVTVTSVDSDTIADSGGPGTIYNDEAGEDYATLTIMLAATTEWVIISGHGSWTTTD